MICYIYTQLLKRTVVFALLSYTQSVNDFRRFMLVYENIHIAKYNKRHIPYGKNTTSFVRSGRNAFIFL